MSALACPQPLPAAGLCREVAIAELQSPILHKARQVWDGARGTRRFPAREDIRPKDLVGILNHVELIRIEGDDFLFRIVGDAIVQAFDFPLQNRRLSELERLDPGFAVIVRPRFRRVADSGEPLAIQGRNGRNISGSNTPYYENLLLPLGPDGQSVDHLLVICTYLPLVSD